MCTRDALRDNTLIMAEVCIWDILVYAGVYAATFSSALASLVGSPRVLYAVAKDELGLPVLPFFSVLNGNGDPARGYGMITLSLITLIITSFCH